MAISFEELSRLVDQTIVRVPDALTGVGGDTAYFCRKAFAGEFAAHIGAKHVFNPALFVTLPFQLCLLTDPHLFGVKNGHLILDHPTIANDGHEYWFGRCASLHARHSLYQNRYPRMIAVDAAGKHSPIELSKYVNTLMYSYHAGLYEKLEPAPHGAAL